jgi:hypothetical protein
MSDDVFENLTYLDEHDPRAQELLESWRQTEQHMAEQPPTLESTLVGTSIRLPFPAHEKLRTYCAEHGTTVSALVRQLVEGFLATEDRLISVRDLMLAVDSVPAADQTAA